MMKHQICMHDRSQNMYANILLEVFKYALEMEISIKNTHTKMNPSISFIYNIITVTLSSTLTMDRMKIIKIEKYIYMD